ncbi:MAG: DNA primase [Chlamydiota bacterium]
MAKFSQESLELLREKIDLFTVLSSHLSFKKQGGKYVALCPFHEERTPSFMLRQGESHYHCFGCGAHGDAIQFLMQFLRLSFAEAVETLAEIFQVSMEKRETTERKGPGRARLKDTLDSAARFYQYYLLHAPEGRKALTYLYDRGIDLKFIQAFRLGCSPERSGVFAKYMQAKNISQECLMQTGMLRNKGTRNYDTFSHRIMIPILDRSGAVIGFSARKFSDRITGAKYINTQETPLFKKSQVLFGLGWARKAIIQTRSVLIVEGQFDALRLLYSGFDNAVASQGTAFTQEQVRILISLGVETVFLAFDADKAGQNSTQKVGCSLQKEGIDVFVVDLPLGEDPDSLLQEQGPDHWKSLIEKARDYLTFLYEKKEQEVPILSPASKTKIVTEIADMIRSWDSPLLVHESLRRLSQLASVPEWTLCSKEPGRSQASLPKTLDKSPLDPNQVLEADFLRPLFLLGSSEPDWLRIAERNLAPEQLSHPSAQRLYALCKEELRKNFPLELLAIHSKIREEDRNFWDHLLEKRIDPEKAFSHFLESIQKILERRWMEQREEIKNKIMKAQFEEDEALALAKQFDDLKKAPPKVLT